MITLTLDKPVGELARETPGLGRFFHQLGIDFCCGGRKTLRDACAARGLDAATVAALLTTADLTPTAPPRLAFFSRSAVAVDACLAEENFDHAERRRRRSVAAATAESSSAAVAGSGMAAAGAKEPSVTRM